MFNLFRRKKQPLFYEKPDEFYVILINDNPYKTVEVWINVDKIFRRPPRKGDCFRYDLHRNRKSVHCTVMAICDNEDQARQIASNLYV